MKNKLVVMFLTLIVMIALTPLIFNKLMNAKFDTMLLKLSQQKGIQITQIKDKSTYLTTDRVFDVKIPGNLIGQNDIKFIELQTETTFKNLPVTDVRFLNNFKKIVLDDNETLPIDKLKLLVITPDFKIFKYKLFNNKIKKDNTTFSWSGFEGIFDKTTFTFKNTNGKIDIKDNISTLNISDIKVVWNKNKNFQQIHFDANFTSPTFNFKVKNFLAKSDVNIDENKLNSTSFLNVDKIEANGIVKILDIDSKFKINGIDKNAFEKIQNKTYTKEDIDELLNNGFNGELDLNIKNIFFIQDLGFLDLNSKFSVRNGSLDKIQNNDLSFLDLNISMKTSPNLLNVFSNLYPFLKDMAVVKNNQAVLNITINKGNITINGKQIKSD